MKHRRLFCFVLALISLCAAIPVYARVVDGDANPGNKTSTPSNPITYTGSNKSTINDLAYAAVTQAGNYYGATYGNPGLYDVGGSSGSSSSTKKTSTTSGKSGTSSQPTADPSATPKAGSGTSGGGSGGGGGGGGGSYVPPVTPDLTITGITPTTYRGNATAMTLVTVQGLAAAAVGSVDVQLDAGGVLLTKTVSVPANGTATAVFVWTAPQSGPITLTATVNPSQAVTETSYSNNSMSVTASIRAPFIDAEEQPTAVPIPTRPSGENNNYVTWQETTNGVTTTYWAQLSLSAGPSISKLKSGYGFGVTVTATVTTNYSGSFAPSDVVMYIPERNYNEVVHLVRDGGTWTLPVSPYSPIGAQKWYVPVWFPDNTAYEPIVTAVGASTPGGELTATAPLSILINGNMYEDDSTNSTIW